MTTRWNRFGSLARLLSVAMMLMYSAALVAQSGGSGKPEWLTANNQTTDDGEFRLEWKALAGEYPEIYRLTESFNGAVGVAYVDGSALDLFRAAPGAYTFKIAACVRGLEGVQSCGTESKAIKVTVSDQIFADVLADQQDGGNGGVTAQSAVVGGPDDLQPGLWHNPAKVGQGWSFYWANRLALSQNPSNAYDLYGIWYTYEAKRLVGGVGPIDYRPVVATMKLAKDANSNNYNGAISIKRGSTNFDVGYATVVFSSDNEIATITWDADFKWQDLADSDVIQLLAGSHDQSATDNTHLAGLWGNTAASYYVVHDLGFFSEAVEVVFYDDNGDPTWIQAVNSGAPSSSSEYLCLYHIQGGFRPDQDRATLPGPRYTTCNPDDATPSSHNGLRYFSGYEVGRYWASFTLPPGSVNDQNAVAGGSVNIGTSGNPATLTKAANFHRIWFNGGNSCQISSSVPSCNATLTWFTDGDYPNATAYALNQTTGTRTKVVTSNEPAMENQIASLSSAGTYLFELRMSDSPSAALMAVSSPFTVTFVQNLPATPTGLAGVWTNQTNGDYRIQWSHPNTGDVNYYELVETPPTGSAVTHPVSPGTTLSKSFSRPSGPYGNYLYRVKACKTSVGCSAETASITWVMATNPPPTTQYPWSQNQHGSLTTNQSGSHALGYHFTPLVNGQVTHLGGYFSGAKTVKLFHRPTGNLLAQATVSSSNAWNFVSISPVSVTAGVEYTVAMYSAGSGYSYRSGLSLPKTYGNITILKGTSIPTNTNPDAIPTNNNSSVIYGQPDIGFLPAAIPQPQAPTITPIADQQHEEGASVSLQVVAADSDGTISSYSAGGSLPGA